LENSEEKEKEAALARAGKTSRHVAKERIREHPERPKRDSGKPYRLISPC